MSRDSLVSSEDLLGLDLADLERIWDDLPWVYQDAVACHPKAPLHLLWYALRAGRWTSRHGLPRGPIPKDLVWDIFLSQAFKFHAIDRKLARHYSVEPDAMMVLAELGDNCVRRAIAEHPNATQEVLARLATDPETPVSRKAGDRLWASEELRKFFKNVLTNTDPQSPPH
ncbi:MAG: hypothetical protein HZB91_05885 [Elusimicrobia bacterium]|nr:hypothetical protein [Elusimicrobiota bacterium]